MLLLAAVLTASINIDIDLTSLIHRARQAEPKVTCGINTVGYRFRGAPGQQFEYAGDRYEIPAEGWVELIADRGRTTYQFNNQKLSLGGSERDPFGFRDVTLPSTSISEKGDSK